MSVEEELKKATDERFAAMAKADVEVLEECLSDDLIYIAAAGVVIGKTEIIGNVKSGVFKLESFHTDDFKVKCYGDTAVVVYESVLASSFRGQNRRGHYRTTSVYTKERGHWRLVAQQMTSMPPTPAMTPAVTPALIRAQAPIH